MSAGTMDGFNLCQQIGALFGRRITVQDEERYINGITFNLHYHMKGCYPQVKVTTRTDKLQRSDNIHLAHLDDFIRASSMLSNRLRSKPITYEQAVSRNHAAKGVMFEGLSRTVVSNIYSQHHEHFQHVWPSQLAFNNWLHNHGCSVPMVLDWRVSHQFSQADPDMTTNVVGMWTEGQHKIDMEYLLAVGQWLPTNTGNPSNDLEMLTDELYYHYWPESMQFYECRCCHATLYTLDSGEDEIICPCCNESATTRPEYSVADWLDVASAEGNKLNTLAIHGLTMLAALANAGNLDGQTDGPRTAAYLRNKATSVAATVTRTPVPMSSCLRTNSQVQLLANESDAAIYDSGFATGAPWYELVVATTIARLMGATRRADETLVVGWHLPLLLPDGVHTLRLDQPTLSKVSKREYTNLIYLNMEPSLDPEISSKYRYVVNILAGNPEVEIQEHGDLNVVPGLGASYTATKVTNPGYITGQGALFYHSIIRNQLMTVHMAMDFESSRVQAYHLLGDIMCITRPKYSSSGDISWERAAVRINKPLLRLGINAYVGRGLSGTALAIHLAGISNVTWRVPGSGNAGAADMDSVMDHTYLSMVLGARLKNRVSWYSDSPLLTGLAELMQTMTPRVVKDISRCVLDLFGPVRALNGDAVWDDIERHVSYRESHKAHVVPCTLPDEIPFMAEIGNEDTDSDSSEASHQTEADDATATIEDTPQHNTASTDHATPTTQLATTSRSGSTHKAGTVKDKPKQSTKTDRRKISEPGEPSPPATSTAAGPAKTKGNLGKRTATLLPSEPVNLGNTSKPKKNAAEKPQTGSRIDQNCSTALTSDQKVAMPTNKRQSFKIVHAGGVSLTGEKIKTSRDPVLSLVADKIAVERLLKGQSTHRIIDGVWDGPHLSNNHEYFAWYIRIGDRKDAANTGANTCGLEAMRSAGLIIGNNDECYTVCSAKKGEPLTADQVLLVANHWKHRLTALTIQQDNRGWCQHSNFGSGPVVLLQGCHWTHAITGHVGVVHGFSKDAALEPIIDPELDMTLEQNRRKYVNNYYADKLSQLSTRLTPRMLGKYLSNNNMQLHDPSRGLLHLKVEGESETSLLYNWLQNPGSTASTNYHMLFKHDLSDDPGQWYGQLIRYHMTNLIDVTNWYNDPKRAVYQKVHNATLTPNYERNCTTVSGDLKGLTANDYLRLDGPHEVQYRRLHFDDNQLVVDGVFDSTYNTSSMAIRMSGECSRLTALLLNGDNSKVLTELVCAATLYAGPPGSGKTTHLVASKCDVYLTRTTTARSNLARRVAKSGSHSKVLTLEQCIRNGEVLVGQIGIDEATLFSMTDLLYVVGSYTKKLVMASDLSQISSHDFSYMSGDRPTDSVAHLVRNSTNLTVVRRFGGDQLRAYNQLNHSNYTSTASTTSFMVESITQSELPRLIQEFRPSVVLGFYHNVRRLAQQALGRADVAAEFSTVHSFQGSETDRALLLVPPPPSSEADKPDAIHRRRDYWVAAVTRATVATMLVFVDTETEYNTSNWLTYLEQQIHGNWTTIATKCFDIVESLSLQKVKGHKVKVDVVRKGPTVLQYKSLLTTLEITASEKGVHCDKPALLPDEVAQYFTAMAWEDRLALLEQAAKNATTDQLAYVCTSRKAESQLMRVAWLGKIGRLLLPIRRYLGDKHWSQQVGKDIWVQWSGGCTLTATFNIYDKSGKLVGTLGKQSKLGRQILITGKYTLSNADLEATSGSDQSAESAWLNIYHATKSERAWAHIMRAWEVWFGNGTLYKNQNSAWLASEGLPLQYFINLGDLKMKSLPSLKLVTNLLRPDQISVNGNAPISIESATLIVAKTYVTVESAPFLSELLALLVEKIASIRGRVIMAAIPKIAGVAEGSEAHQAMMSVLSSRLDELQTSLLDRQGQTVSVQPSAQYHEGWTSGSLISTTAASHIQDTPVMIGCMLAINWLNNASSGTIQNATRYRNLRLRTNNSAVADVPMTNPTEEARVVAGATAAEVTKHLSRVTKDVEGAKDKKKVVRLAGWKDKMSEQPGVDHENNNILFVGMEWLAFDDLEEGHWYGVYPATVEVCLEIEQTKRALNGGVDVYHTKHDSPLKLGKVFSLGVIGGYHVVSNKTNARTIVIQPAHITPLHKAYRLGGDWFTGADPAVLQIADHDFRSLEKMRLDKTISNEQLLQFMLTRFGSITYTSKSVGFKVDNHTDAVVNLWSSMMVDRRINVDSAHADLLATAQSLDPTKILSVLNLPTMTDALQSLINLAIKQLPSLSAITKSARDLMAKGSDVAPPVGPCRVIKPRFYILGRREEDVDAESDYDDSDDGGDESDGEQRDFPERTEQGEEPREPSEQDEEDEDNDLGGKNDTTSSQPEGDKQEARDDAPTVKTSAALVGDDTEPRTTTDQLRRREGVMTVNKNKTAIGQKSQKHKAASWVREEEAMPLIQTEQPKNTLIKLWYKATNSCPDLSSMFRAAQAEGGRAVAAFSSGLIPASKQTTQWVGSLDELRPAHPDSINDSYRLWTNTNLTGRWDLVMVLSGARGDSEPAYGVGKHYESTGLKVLWMVSRYNLAWHGIDKLTHVLAFEESIEQNLQFAIGVKTVGPLDCTFVNMGHVLSKDVTLQGIKATQIMLNYTCAWWPLVRNWGGTLHWLHPVPMFAMKREHGLRCGCPIAYGMFEYYMKSTNMLADRVGEAINIGHSICIGTHNVKMHGVWRSDGLYAPVINPDRVKVGTLVTFGSLTPHLKQDVWDWVIENSNHWPKPITVLGKDLGAGWKTIKSYTEEDVLSALLLVHHGGAGTFWTAAMAMTNQVVRPQFFDQLYWEKQAGALCNGDSDNWNTKALPVAGTGKPQRLPLMLSSPTETVNTKLPAGEYTTMEYRLTTTYDPLTETDCVNMCLKASGIRIIHGLDLHNTLGHIKTQVLGSQRSLVVVQGLTTSIWSTGENEPTVVVHIVPGDRGLHCTLANVQFFNPLPVHPGLGPNPTGCRLLGVKYVQGKGTGQSQYCKDGEPVRFLGITRRVEDADDCVSCLPPVLQKEISLVHKGRNVATVTTSSATYVDAPPGSVIMHRNGQGAKAQFKTGQQSEAVTDERRTQEVTVDGQAELWHIWSGAGGFFASPVLPRGTTLGPDEIAIPANPSGTATANLLSCNTDKMKASPQTMHVRLITLLPHYDAHRLVKGTSMYNFKDKQWYQPVGAGDEFDTSMTAVGDRPFKYDHREKQAGTTITASHSSVLLPSSSVSIGVDLEVGNVYTICDATPTTATLLRAPSDGEAGTSSWFYDVDMVPDVVVAPNKSSWSITNDQWPTKLMVTTIETYTNHPETVYYVLTKMAMGELNTVSAKNAGQEILTHRLKDSREIVHDVLSLLLRNPSPIVCHIDQETTDWINNHHSPNRVKSELSRLMDSGQLEDALHSVTFSLKKESLHKPDAYTDPAEVVPRSIIWHPYSVAAIFSPVFKKVKDNLKARLPPNLRYTDGLRPDEIRAIVRAVPRVYGQMVVEDDLSKQDRQTRKALIDAEMEIYINLGLDPKLVRVWKQCHNSWRFKGNHIRGTGNEQRLTGQATTAIGNALVNIMVHHRWIHDNTQLMLICGDDNLAITTLSINAKQHITESRNFYNMASKVHVHSHVGTFCTFLIGSTCDGWDLTPDPVRMRQKFELTHGTAKMTPEVHLARCQSYLAMLGPIPGSKRVISELGMSVQPVQWYDYDTMLVFAANKYDMSTQAVEENLSQLLQYMERPPMEKQIVHWA